MFGDSASTAKPSLTITHVGKVTTSTSNVVPRPSANTTSGKQSAIYLFCHYKQIEIYVRSTHTIENVIIVRFAQSN